MGVEGCCVEGGGGCEGEGGEEGEEGEVGGVHCLFWLGDGRERVVVECCWVEDLDWEGWPSGSFLHPGTLGWTKNLSGLYPMISTSWARYRCVYEEMTSD